MKPTKDFSFQKSIKFIQLYEREKERKRERERERERKRERERETKARYLKIGYPREGVYLINIKIVGFSNEKCDDRHLYGILKPSYIAFFQKCASGACL